jgi:uncharacterized protein
MKLFIKAKPNSKKEFVRKIDSTHYVVSVHAAPVAGKANHAIINVLSHYFHKSLSQISIISGEKSKQKIIDINITSEEIEKLEIQPKLL